MKSLDHRDSQATWLRYLCAITALLGLGLMTGSCSSKPPVSTGFGSSGTGTGGGAGAATASSGGTVSDGGSSAATGGSTGIVVAGNSGAEKCVTSCTPIGGQWCGEIGNNCGNKLQCPACTGDWLCEEGLCVGPPSCERLTCDSGAGRYCGILGDGCGGKLDCGDCPDGGTCAGGGIEHVCKPVNCTPRACTDATSGGQYCGDIGDGCGGVLHCGDCKGGKACGADVANVCPGTGCHNLQCTVVADACPVDSLTTLTGTVYDPAGRLPLYNALVYVPNDPLPLPPISDGVTCEACAAFAAGSPIAAALTDVSGHFTLSGVPSGANVPLVIQVGKWRREVTLDTSLTKCTSNAVTNVDLTRLPRTKAEGHIPRIAVTTGEKDALECLLRRIGIADEEFTIDGGPGRVHLYVGGPVGSNLTQQQGADQFTDALGGALFPHATTLWSDPAKLQSYDILLLSCEGDQVATVKAPYRDNMLAYMNQGGRVFVDHLHFYWLRSGAAELQGTATYLGDQGDLDTPRTALVDTGFDKGAALADWLLLTGASTVRGQLPLSDGQYSVSAVTAPTTQRWIYVEDPKPAIQYMTFNTPVPAAPADQCGRVVYTDIHVSSAVTDPAGGATTGGDTSSPTTPFPGGCSANAMSPQAKALEFMFFDLSSCVTPVSVPPVPPPPPPPPPPK